MDEGSPRPEGTGDGTWERRQLYWRRKLGRLRLGVEPLEVQVVRYRRVTWMISAVCLLMASMFVALFSAFRRPDVGLWMAGILFAPMLSVAWLDFALLSARAQRYTRELREHEARRAPRA